MYRVALCADSRWRDTYGLGFVHLRLLKMGFDARIISFHIADDAIRLFRPHIIVLNHLSGKRNQRLARFVRRTGGRVVIMPTEGRDATKWLKRQNSGYDLFLAWNDEVADKMPNSVVAGCPRFDVYRPEYRKLISGIEEVRAQYGIADNASKVIGITTAFPTGKFAYTHRQFHRNDWKDLDVEDNPDFLAESEYRLAQQFKNWIQNAIQSAPQDWEFILKPHPMADRAMWSIFCDENNIILAPPDYAHNFMAAIDILVARVGCLTVQDGWLMGKPVIQVNLPPERKEPVAESVLEANSIGLLAHQSDDLRARINYGTGYSDEARDWIAEYLSKYGYVHEKPSGQIISDAIGSLEVNSLPGRLTFDEEIAFSKLQNNLMALSAYPSLMELHTQKHIPEQVVWGAEMEMKRYGLLL